MGYGFKHGGSGLFRCGLSVITNPNATITATLADGGATYTTTADGNGNAFFEIKKKGTYNIEISGITTTGCVLSTTPASSASVDFNKTNVTKLIHHVYVGDINELLVGGYSSYKSYVCWDKPSNYCTSINVRYDTSSTPTSIGLGTEAYVGIGDSVYITSDSKKNGFTQDGLTNGTTYYYSGWSFYEHPNGTRYYANRRTGSWKSKAYSLNQSFDTTSTYKIPEGIRKITVFCCGGGGSGSALYNSHHGGSGGGGGRCNRKEISVIPNQEASVTIGKGGVAAQATKTNNFANGKNGGATTFSCGDTSVTASGGGGGIAATYSTNSTPRGGGNGGSGGGAGGWYVTGYYCKAGHGGSNGGDGGSATNGTRKLTGGVGEGSASVTFNGVAYAGGGGGGYGGYQSSPSASGGISGGGAGGSYTNTASGRNDGGAGAKGTGGGGGGSASVYDSERNDIPCYSGAGGDGVVVIIG